MIALSDPLGQPLLQLDQGLVLDMQEQVLARVRGNALVSRIGQRLAHVEGDTVYLAAYRPVLRIIGDALCTPCGLTVARASNATTREAGLLGAAFLLFCTDG